MPTVDVLLRFAVASLLLDLAPGPSVVLAVATGVDRGWRAGVVVAVGLGAGVLAWGGVVAAGLAAVVAASPGAVTVLTGLGGCYLLWLAWTTWRAPSADVAAAPGRARTGASAARSPLVAGVVTNLANPTLVPFLAAVLPPFLAVPGPPVWAQGLALTTVLAVVSALVNAGWAAAGALLGRRSRGASGRTTSRVAALALAGIGLGALVRAAT